MSAQVTFAHGGLVLPAGTPYDRQLVRDHIVNTARRAGGARIVVAGDTWVVESPGQEAGRDCKNCQRHLTTAALRKPDSHARFCVTCVLS